MEVLDLLKQNISVYESNLILKAFKKYPRPMFPLGTVFVSDCQKSEIYPIESEIQMLPGDLILVIGCVPITYMDGSLVIEAPFWCYTFKNLTRNIEFDMQGAPAAKSILKQTEAIKVLFE